MRDGIMVFNKLEQQRTKAR